MATIEIFRDAPVIASKVRPNGSMPNRLQANLNGRNITIPQYLLGGITDDPEPELQNLTQQSRRGDRHYRNHWCRTIWQTEQRFF